MTLLLLAMVGLFSLLARRDAPPTARTHVLLLLGIAVLLAGVAAHLFVLHPLAVPATSP